MTVDIVSYRPDVHEEDLLRFLRRQYPGSLKGRRAHFEWRFRDGVYGPAPIYLLAMRDGEIVGQWASMPDVLQVGDQQLDVAWMIDLVVDEAHRDSFAAMRLFRRAQRAGLPLLATGAGAHMSDFYRVFRWDRRMVCETYYSVVRPTRLMAMAGQEPGGLPARLLWHLSDGVGPLLQRALVQVRGSDPDIFPLDEFDDSVDHLFGDLHHSLGVTPIRSRGVYEWRFTRRPWGRHQSFGLRGPSGRLRGLIVVKLRQRGVVRWAELADVLVARTDREGFVRLVDAGRRFALDTGCDFVRLRCSLSEHVASLRRPSWVRRVRSPVDDLFLFCADPIARDRLIRMPWHYTALCSDNIDSGNDEWADPAANNPGASACRR